MPMLGAESSQLKPGGTHHVPHVEPNAGFWIEENVLSLEECVSLISAVALQQRPGRAGARHLMANPAVAALANDPRLLEIARRGLNKDAVPYRATLFEKSGRANWLVVWHQDTALPLVAHFDSPEWGPWSKKCGVIYAHAPTWALSRVLALRVHLDASTSENGPLRIIPFSHAAGVLTDEEVFRTARTREHVDCLVPQGGVLAMRPLLIHSSSKAREAEPRRVLHIEYADSLILSEQIRLAIT
jgi:ectoine hydroxylase-related dioxygenase (phytanoyl-CoA dioxygenase family)